MGYTKEKAISGEIEIPMLFRVRNLDLGTIEDETVIHYVEFPSRSIREKHDQESVKVKGRKIKTQLTSANWNMWLRVIIRVEGYDDLLEPDNSDKQKLQVYFSGDKERIHVDECISRLNEMISAEDVEVEKKIRAIFRGIIWGTAEQDPYIGDQIKAELVNKDPDEEEIPNPILDEYLEFYDCDDLLPFANRVFWLNGVREALGHIPNWFNITHEEIRSLVILREETSKKMQHESFIAKREASQTKAQTPKMPRVKR